MKMLMVMLYAMSQDVALCCCALFAGGSCYVSLVEQPTILRAREDLTGAYILLAQPRPAVFETAFAAFGALAGIVAGISGSAGWWLAGGLLLATAFVYRLAVIGPQTRRILEMGLHGDLDNAHGQLKRLAKLHAAQSLLGLGALFTFIFGT